ncbi:DUF4286 family protein [Pseudonocardia benzenivorans]|jgi:hypothetical protein|uniref:Uncharacterized protein n=2 Tax=Pseudonocardia TaxID=1847 RepID=F4CJN2_PSEUX|nr:DUF4286 family protein [Pseudonocardia dioxanivorans]AEA25892.1 hypothetical protein Psed_3722 [Pseudonocardia dioxanivorans CB1190]GJF06348.1 hypothetical protein PSD17_52950 [Pseudonocardia sp. D17]
MTEPTDRAKGLLLVMIDIDPAYEEEFNRWYTEEHFPERQQCPGFLSARRFVSVEGEPKYLALYDLDDPEVLETEEYRRIRPPSEWTRKLQPHFTTLVRNVYREITPTVPDGYVVHAVREQEA